MQHSNTHSSIPALALAAFLFVGAAAPNAYAQDASQPNATAASSPTSTPNPTSTPAQCVPECRDGFLCRETLCVSACNPPCASDSICRGSGSSAHCALVPVEAQPSATTDRPILQETPQQLKERVAWKEKQQRERAERGKQREERARKAQSGERYEAKVVQAYSSKPRMILGMRLGLHATSNYILNEDVSGGQIGIQWGVRWHFNQRFGSMLTVEALLGNWVGDYEYSTEGRVSSLRTQFAPYFRPSRQLMIGPTFAFGRNAYTVNRDRFGRDVATDSAWVSGFGVQVGWLTGRHQDVMMTSGLMVLDEVSGSSLRGNTVELYGSVAFAF